MDADSEELTAFVAELRHASELLASRGIANERMALAVVDSLAERLLYHHEVRHYRSGRRIALPLKHGRVVALDELRRAGLLTTPRSGRAALEPDNGRHVRD